MTRLPSSLASMATKQANRPSSLAERSHCSRHISILVVKDRLLCGAFRGYNLQFQHYEVKNSTVSGTFDETVKGVRANIHKACVLLLYCASRQPLIQISVAGSNTERRMVRYRFRLWLMYCVLDALNNQLLWVSLGGLCGRDIWVDR